LAGGKERETGVEPFYALPEAGTMQRVAETGPETFAHSFARESQKSPSEAPEATLSASPPAGPQDPDLARLIDAWPTLFTTARRMILAAVEADDPAG